VVQKFHLEDEPEEELEAEWRGAIRKIRRRSNQEATKANG